MSISVFENDIEGEQQLDIIEKFIFLKKDNKPYTTLRLIGEVDQEKYKHLGLPIITRTLHSPMGSFNYKNEPTIPEIGICLDFLNHLAIDVDGNVSICVRFDPKGLGIIGNTKNESLEQMWNSEKRLKWKDLHIKGQRCKIPLCSYCKFWGVPIKK
jgi:radical SAM protein with 4Fe4S-binding SPASM domain